MLCPTNVYMIDINSKEIFKMEIIAGGLAAAGACLFTNPMEVVKNRLQLQVNMILRVIPQTSARPLSRSKGSRSQLFSRQLFNPSIDFTTFVWKP